jgi:filamentous hemagglutinin
MKAEFIIAKTLDTLCVSYLANPGRVYWQLKRCIDVAADLEPHTVSGLELGRLLKKTVHLAIPETSTPEQWRHLYRAIVYGKKRGVSLVITRIRGWA